VGAAAVNAPSWWEFVKSAARLFDPRKLIEWSGGTKLGQMLVPPATVAAIGGQAQTPPANQDGTINVTVNAQTTDRHTIADTAVGKIIDAMHLANTTSQGPGLGVLDSAHTSGAGASPY
jgi:hypothetical protein